jgi:predicted nuclease of predicted toxin-antitoxin system
MTIKLLLDMNIPLDYASYLADRGFEVVRWSDIGSPYAPDVEIMDYACDNDYIVLTYDLDFSAILSLTQKSKPSIAQVRASIQQAEYAADIIASALKQNVNELKKGAILSIDIKKSRLRLLPL